ncbi:glycoside hydrolase family 19 protein [Methylolobus aquaticus]
MQIDSSLFVNVGVRRECAERYAGDFNTLLARYGIDTPLRVAHFLAQVLHESGLLRHVEENLNYSAKGLRSIFGKYFRSDAEANAFARQPAKIANRVYANRIGNGSEASGDGYRFRGRGLIQLTGRANYQSFSDWLGVDVVSAPDKVASDYAVHSAVFYWSTRKRNGLSLNTYADRDSLLDITRAVNGGTIGLEDRKHLLLKLKQQLASRPGVSASLPTATTPERLPPTHSVTASSLNLRSQAVVNNGNRLAALPQGTPIALLEGKPEDAWWKIQVALNGRLFEGFVASAHLKPFSGAPAARAAAPAAAIPPAHLQQDRPDITRARDGGRAFPLGEKPRPGRQGAVPAERVDEIHAIVAYLDSAKAAHKRYWPQGSTTFCNIYAYDYCYLVGPYLPRVWWKNDALERLQRGDPVDAVYDRTVRELNANALHDWLEDYGERFGWQRAADIDELQRAANDGGVCLIVAKRKDLNRSGHITAVVPETDDFSASRNAQGMIQRPVESQAGATNYRLVVQNRAWWLDPKFSSFGLWHHA